MHSIEKLFSVSFNDYKCSEIYFSLFELQKILIKSNRCDTCLFDRSQVDLVKWQFFLKSETFLCHKNILY